MIELKNLQKSYGTTQVLKGIDARIAPGDFITIVGASGAGKSTLLHLLAGLDLPSTGGISFEGKDLDRMSKAELNTLRNKRIGLVFQFHNLLPELTALENVLLPHWIGRDQSEGAEDSALSLLTFLGVDHRKDHLPSQMSGGEQQRVAIARALMNKPALLLADEPTGNLDSQNAEAVHQMLIKLNKEQGQTIVVVTHNEELAALGDRRWVMKDGLLTEEA